LEAANRELIEEIGYGAKKLSFGWIIYRSDVITDSCI
jgi:8-oxo-dGTP pyrophosphatase MutT (NUDIX family)